MAAGKICLLLPPAHSDKDWAHGVMKKNVERLLDAICCEGKTAESADPIGAEEAVLTAQSLSDLAAKMLGADFDEEVSKRLQKCAGCVLMRFSLAHVWVNCRPTGTGLPDCAKLKAH